MTDPPRMLDGARVLLLADLSEVRATGRTVHEVYGERMGKPAALAIAAYDSANKNNHA